MILKHKNYDIYITDITKTDNITMFTLSNKDNFKTKVKYLFNNDINKQFIYNNTKIKFNEFLEV